MKLGDIIHYITKYTGIKYLVETYYAFKARNVTATSVEKN